MFGLNLTAWLAIACAVLGIVVVAEGIAVKGAWDSEAAARRELAIVTKDRDAQADGLVTAKAALKRQQDRMDENDAAARRAIEVQQAGARDLAVRLQSATDIKNAAIAQIQENIDARPQTADRVPDGWDPYVVAGMRHLRCVQLASVENRDPADCRVPPADDPGRSGLAGNPTGTAYPRPSARQQLDFLAFAWSLREWGASCYDDKRAIAASQAVTP